MVAYVLVRTDDLRPGPALIEYLQRVDVTLEAHGARILVQGFPDDVREGEWAGFITLLEFPTIDAARTWYDSPEYQALKPLRTGSSTPTDLIVEGVSEGHRSADLVRLLASGRG